MTQKFTAEEVRAVAASFARVFNEGVSSMLNAYADTLSKPADSGRVTGSRLFSGDLDVLASLGFPKTAERIRAALAAQGQGDGAPGFGLSDGDVAALRDAGLKPEEIAGDAVKQQARVSELVHWFARFLRGSANPKWLMSHAMELAYYIATNAGNRHIDVSEIRQDGFKSGLNVTPAQRSMLERIGVANPAPPASPAGVPDGLDESSCVPVNRPNIYAAGWNDYRDCMLAAAPSAPEGDGGEG